MQTIEQIARKVRRAAAHLTVAEQDAIITRRVAASHRENARHVESQSPEAFARRMAFRAAVRAAA